MPIISAFFGIVIRMFYKEHEPAHFHPVHAGQPAKFDFDGAMIAGAIRSRKARQRIRQWAPATPRRLDANWEKMKAGRPLESIEPEQQQECVRRHPVAFVPEKGAWGRQGCTAVRLDSIDEEAVGEAMTRAWRNSAAKRVLSRPKAKGATRRLSTRKR